jgi:hypothetical protein
LKQKGELFSRELNKMRDNSDTNPSTSSDASWAVLEKRFPGIRQRMLDSLGTAGAQKFPVIAHRVDRALDAEDLWHLRVPLMEALRQTRGEATAREEIARISVLFTL